MAITTAVFKTNILDVATWDQTDVIDLIEDAHTWLGWHSADAGGHIVGLTTYAGGGNANDNTHHHYEVEGTSSGLGTDAIFHVYRYNSTLWVGVNNPGVGYTGRETITIPASSIGGTGDNSQVTDMVLKPYVHSTVSNGVGYAITVTYNSPNRNWSGLDRNGAVNSDGTTEPTITIKEGDTITFHNEMGSSSYDLQIINNTYDTTSSNENKVANVINQGADNNETMIWTPLVGQAGEYRVVDDANYGDYARLVVQEASAGDITYPTVGLTTGFYDKHTGGGYQGTHPWGIVRNVIQSGKKKGISYQGYIMDDADSVAYAVAPYYFPHDYNDGSNNYGTYHGHGHSHRFAGVAGLDVGGDAPFHPTAGGFSPQWDVSFQPGESTYPYILNRVSATQSTNRDYAIVTGSNTQYQLDLNVFRSSLDPNFAVFSFRAPTLSATNINGNTYGTWFTHKFVTDIWDLDHVFLGGHTQIKAETNTSTSQPYIRFQTYTAGTQNVTYNYDPAVGTAEYGYNVTRNDTGSYTSGMRYYTTTYACSTLDETYSNQDVHFYYRSRTNYPHKSGAVWFEQGQTPEHASYALPSEADFNAVIKGIPLSTQMMPVPYYIPDDFVFINFNYNAVNANIQQGDTITLSPSEVYTVIMGSYNMTSDGITRGILFCARKV